MNLACLNGPYTLEPTLRRDVPLTKLERHGKFSFATVLRLRQMIVRERPATVVAVNLYQALYVACATFAAAVTAAHRGAGQHFDIPRPSSAQVALSVGARRGSIRSYTAHRRSARSGTSRPAAHPGPWRNPRVIYNGVDSAHFEPVVAFEAAKRLRASLGVKPGALLIGTVGRLAPEKNHEVLLTTLRRLRVARVDAHLVIAGDGPLREHLLRRAAELEIADRVHLHRRVRRRAAGVGRARCVRVAVDRRRIVFERRARGDVDGPSGDPLGHRRRTRNDPRRCRRLRGLAHRALRAAAGDHRRAVRRAAQASAAWERRRAPAR